MTHNLWLIINYWLFLDTAEYVEMCEIVDPYSYLGRYGRSQTVLVQNAGNDEFFLPSDTWFFWDEMFGEKYLKESYYFIGGEWLKCPRTELWRALLSIFFVQWLLGKIYQNKGHGGVGLSSVFEMTILLFHWLLSIYHSDWSICNQFENRFKGNFWSGNTRN